MCNLSFYTKNDCGDDNYSNINTCAVAGTVAIGCGQAQLEEFLSCLNLPKLQERTYNQNHQLISKHWENVALETMKEAVEKEKEVAISEGRVNKDGIAIIDVKVDGCWSKRSYIKRITLLHLGPLPSLVKILATYCFSVLKTNIANCAQRQKRIKLKRETTYALKIMMGL